MSGEQSFEVLDKMFEAKEQTGSIEEIKGYTMKYGNISRKWRM